MLKIIHPKNQKSYQSNVDAFLDLLNIYQDVELSPERQENATFMIVSDHSHGVYGGAVFYPQQVYDLQDDEHLDGYEDDFRSIFMTFQPHVQKFWMARICFCLDTNLSPKNFNELVLCKKFYDELYEAILDFGYAKDIEFLPFSLCSFDSLEPPYYCEWPDNLPFRRSDDTSGLYYGILSLTGKKFLPKFPRNSSKSQRFCSIANENEFHENLYGSMA